MGDVGKKYYYIEPPPFPPRIDVDLSGNQESIEYGDCQGKQKGQGYHLRRGVLFFSSLWYSHPHLLVHLVKCNNYLECKPLKGLLFYHFLSTF